MISLFANLIFGLFYIGILSKSVIAIEPFTPEKVYNFKTLIPYSEIKDIADSFKYFPKEIRNSLDSMGIKIIYHKSFFENPCSSPFSGTYRPWDHQVEIYCKRELSVLVAEGSHALDQFNGQGEFKSAIDSDFSDQYILYRNKIRQYTKTSDFRAWWIANYPKGTWSYLPGKEDSNPLLGPQGYQDIVELFMEGFIYYCYNPNKLKSYYPDIYVWVENSLKPKLTSVNYPVFSSKDIIIDYL